MIRTNLKGLTVGELEAFALSIGEQSYRGKQLFTWLYSKGATTFDEVSSLSKALRLKLSSSAVIESMRCAETRTSRDDGTTKFLFELPDGKRIETVAIPPRTAFSGTEARMEDEQQRLTLCVSTQVGCPLDCKFCATGTMGFLRNLTPGEIVDQVLQVNSRSPRRITNLVFMGMGEPLVNYENVMKSIEILTTGLKIAARRMTLSTAGWVPGILRMADEQRKVKLAVSLHSLDEEKRSALMPINKKYNIRSLLDAVHYYYTKVGTRPTFEYILFDGWNDGIEDVRRLVKLARSLPCKFNIIPFHSIAFASPLGIATELRPTPREKMELFVRKLRESHLTVFVRSSAGEDIEAACGQLAVAVERRRAKGPQTASARITTVAL